MARKKKRKTFGSVLSLGVTIMLAFSSYHLLFSSKIANEDYAQLDPVSVDELHTNLSDHANRVTKLQGQVHTPRYLLCIGAYQLRDSMGNQVLVLTRYFPLQEGAYHQLPGYVKPAFKISDQSSLIIIESKIVGP